jgi:DNA-binding transcriptional LysR family regulator
MFGHAAMGRIAARFTEVSPEVRLEIIAEDRYVDLVEEGFDIAIRVNPDPDDQLVGRAFCTISCCWWPSVTPRPPQGTGVGVGPSIPGVGRTDADAGAWRISSEGREMTLLPDPVFPLCDRPRLVDYRR